MDEGEDSVSSLNLAWVPTYLADIVVELAEKAVFQSLIAVGCDEDTSKKEAAYSANYVFVGEHGMLLSWMSEAQDKAAQDINIGEVADTKKFAEMIAVGAEMRGVTMVEWMQISIQNQFARDSIEKGERDGDLVWTGQYRNRQPVFVKANHIKGRMN